MRVLRYGSWNTCRSICRDASRRARPKSRRSGSTPMEQSLPAALSFARDPTTATASDEYESAAVTNSFVESLLMQLLLQSSTRTNLRSLFSTRCMVHSSCLAINSVGGLLHSSCILSTRPDRTLRHDGAALRNVSGGAGNRRSTRPSRQPSRQTNTSAHGAWSLRVRQACAKRQVLWRSAASRLERRLNCQIPQGSDCWRSRARKFVGGAKKSTLHVDVIGKETIIICYSIRKVGQPIDADSGKSFRSEVLEDLTDPKLVFR